MPAAGTCRRAIAVTGGTHLPARLRALVSWLRTFRYLKFGIVGASGTIVNLSVLYLGQEFLFRAIEPDRSRLYVSLGFAIAVATVNNFVWNRWWTWGDRTRATAAAPNRSGDVFRQLARYAVASWLGIALQYGLTLWMSLTIDYRLANIVAILLASVCNFLAHHHWSFRHRPRPPA
jgi:putative flippase GtrA